MQSTTLNPNDIPPGALISFIQKGLQYLELEVNLNDSVTDVEGDFSLLTPRDLMTKTAAELKTLVRSKKSQMEKQRSALMVKPRVPSFASIPADAHTLAHPSPSTPVPLRSPRRWMWSRRRTPK